MKSQLGETDVPDQDLKTRLVATCNLQETDLEVWRLADTAHNKHPNCGSDKHQVVNLTSVCTSDRDHMMA